MARTIVPLIPTDCASALEGTQNFHSVFEARYCKDGRGHLMPLFFIGSLQAAIREAFDCPDRPVSERRPLALYIHHDGSVARNVFPQTVLCNDGVLALLRSQFIVWPWDVTEKENEEKLSVWLNEASLYDVRAHVSNFVHKVDWFPLLVLLSKEVSQLRMVTHVIGSESAEQAMEKLLMCMEGYATTKVALEKQAADRAEREALRREQERELQAEGPLIPATCASAAEGTQSFRTGFATRHCANGALVPPFFIGSLQEAISEAFDKPIIAERRALVLYIHQDGCSSMHSFQKELCFDETVAMLRSNFVIWPWDVTTKENKVKLMTWLTESSLYNVISEVTSALEISEAVPFPEGFFMMLMLTKTGIQLNIEEKIGTHHQAGKIFDTLTKVMKQYADIKNDQIERKYADQTRQTPSM